MGVTPGRVYRRTPEQPEKGIKENAIQRPLSGVFPFQENDNPASTFRANFRIFRIK